MWEVCFWFVMQDIEPHSQNVFTDSLFPGFSTAILHGMCSYGIATRHIMRQYCNNDTSMVKAIKVRACTLFAFAKLTFALYTVVCFLHHLMALLFTVLT